MAAADAGRPTTGTGRRAPARSVTLSTWVGLGSQLLFLALAIALIAVGSAYQSAAITANTHAQRLQIVNQSITADLRDTGTSLHGYQASGQDRFLQSYYANRYDFVVGLRQARSLAWPAVLPALEREADAAQTAIRLGEEAVAARAGGARASLLFAGSRAALVTFLGRSAHLQGRLAADSASLAARSQRSLGIGVAGAAAALLAGLLIPVLAGVLTMRWALLPLHRATAAVGRLAAGEHDARVVPSGPAELRTLGDSINYLADENDRMRAELESRAELAGLVRRTAARIREHLEVSGVIRDAADALREGLRCDFAWVGVIVGGELSLPEGNPDTRGLGEAAINALPPGYADWLQSLYQRRSSYLAPDLRSADAAGQLPAGVRDALLRIGGVWLLVTPFGTGQQVEGSLILLRADPGLPWSPVEIGAVESVASDVGRGVEHATLYARQKDLVEQLTTVDRAKSNFLAGITHDLRSPLTGIIGNVDLLGEDPRPLTTAQRQMIEAIGRNADRLAGLVDDLLAMSMIELGSFGPSLRPVDLAEVLRSAVEQISAVAREKGISLEASGPRRGLPVLGDSGQLDRALANLLGNAVKYTPAGGQVTVTAGRDSGHVFVSVRDTGIGIPEAEQPSLFTRFYRASNAVSRAIPGTGLGLAIVRAIVDNHKGDIELSSQEGAGTTVTIRLPIRAGGRTPAGPPEAAARRGTADRAAAG